MWRQKGINDTRALIAESEKHNGRGSLELKSSRYGALGVPMASTIAECIAVQSATAKVYTPQCQPLSGGS